MESRALRLTGSWLFTPTLHPDGRGVFLEAFTQRSFKEAVGHSLVVQQTNISVSSRGTVRGIHFAEVPPGQAKYVQCLDGEIMDVVVDIRVGSPTFGQWEAVLLNSQRREALYLAEGLGHAFCALSEMATVGYMCSEPYRPQSEHSVQPLDSRLDIAWPNDLNLQLSERDRRAPTLVEAQQAGLLPLWQECQDFYTDLRID